MLKSIFERYGEVEEWIDERIGISCLFPNDKDNNHLKILSHFVVYAILDRVTFSDENCKKEMMRVATEVGIELGIDQNDVFKCIDNVVSIVKQKNSNPQDPYNINIGLNEYGEVQKTYLYIALIQYVKGRLVETNVNNVYGKGIEVNQNKKGRPNYVCDDKLFQSVYDMYINGEITSVEASNKLGCGKTTFFRQIDNYGLQTRQETKTPNNLGNNKVIEEDTGVNGRNNQNSQIDEIESDGKIYRTQSKLIRSICGEEIPCTTVNYIMQNIKRDLPKSLLEKTIKRSTTDWDTTVAVTFYEVNSFEEYIKEKFNIVDFVIFDEKHPNNKRGGFHRQLLLKEISLEQAEEMISGNSQHNTKKDTVTKVEPQLVIVGKNIEPLFTIKTKKKFFGRTTSEKIYNGNRYILVLSNKDEIVVSEERFNNFEIGMEYCI